MNHSGYKIPLGVPLVGWILTLSLGFTALIIGIAAFAVDASSRGVLLEPVGIMAILTYLSYKAGVGFLAIDAHEKQIVASPSWWARKLQGDTGATMRIAPGSELLFCRRMGYGALIGYQILLRTPDGHDHVLCNYPVHALSQRMFSRQRRKKIAEEVPRLFGLGVRSVTQAVSQSGVEELNWSVEDDKRLWRNLRWSILPGLAPFFGIVARLVTPGPEKIAAIGVALWMFCVGLLYLYGRRSKPDPTNRLWVSILTWTLLFVPTYAATALFMNAFLNRAR